MECEAMGRVLTEATIENLEDLWRAKRGELPADQVRRLTIDNALVDTGCSTLALPTRFIKQLGLDKAYQKRATPITGTATVDVYETVRLTIMGRPVPIDPIEVPDDVPVLIGQIPLEALDLIPDLRAHRLIGNPAHGGEHILDLL